MDSDEKPLPITMVNGQPCDYPALSDMGFQYGDGVFETMYCESGSLPLLSYHLERLENASQRLNIHLDICSVELQLQQALALFSGKYARVKLILTRGEGGAAAYPVREQTPNIYIQVYPFVKEGNVQAGELVIVPKALEMCSLLAGIKHMNRLPYIAASLNVSVSQGQDLLFCDSMQNVIETMRHNVFFAIGKKLVTPSVERLGVAGVMRRVIKDKLAGLVGMQYEERDIPLFSITHYDECFVSNALRGISPIRKIGECTFSETSTYKKLRHAMSQLDLKL